MTDKVIFTGYRPFATNYASRARLSAAIRGLFGRLRRRRPPDPIWITVGEKAFDPSRDGPEAQPLAQRLDALERRVQLLETTLRYHRVDTPPLG